MITIAVSHVELAHNPPIKVVTEPLTVFHKAVVTDIPISLQAPELFNLPEPYTSDEDCDLHVGGHPYMHLFRHYLMV